ncbi:MAG: F0F1 ATP synthase subunit A [Lentisphaerae bacterium]|nr:F0F1 ATP synthase subunit A [Lentisphaerota bacterium]
MHSLSRHVLIALPRVWGVDFSITNQVVLLWAAALITFLLLAPACRRRNPVPRGLLQNVLEGVIDGIDNHVIGVSVGRRSGWAPFLLSLFFFVLFANLLGVVPVPTHVAAATANLSVTAGLALTVFAVVVGVGIRHRGIGGFFRQFVPAGAPRWCAPLVAPIEVVTWLARPFSLAIRLFANMAAGHALILVFLALLSAVAFYLKPLPLAGAVVMSAFELFVCFIQAFIFTLLTGLYIGEALAGKH